MENLIAQDEEVINSDTAIRIGRLILGANPFLTIEVNRDRLIEDTLNFLSKPNINYKKELKVF